MAEAKKKEVSAWELCLHFPPFLVHVALVLIVGWISSCLNFNLPLVFTFGLAYLYFVEERIKAKTESRIRSEQRRANDRKRLLSDAETARWLNSTVEAVWPIFLENFASQKFLMSLAPWFLEKYKPWTAKKVVLQQICLGRCPPVFSMLRSGHLPTDGDHLVLEMDMKFVAARDMSAVIAVQIRKRVGFGLWTSLNISNIQIEGKLRIGIRFSRGWPVVERLRVCFSEAPILRMTAKPIINYGIDVTDLPGIASWIDKMIAEALEDSLVEPNVLEVELEKLVGSMMAVNSQLPTPTKDGPWFSVRNPKVAKSNRKHPVANLKVEILDGKKLKPSDPNGKADPYVKLRFGSVKHVTTIKRKTLQPAWHEPFEFPVESWGLQNILLLRVRDKDRFGHDDEMGYKEIECKPFNDGLRREMLVTLDGVKTGQLRIAITVEEVPMVEHVTELTKSNVRLESENANSEFPSSGDKVKNSWIESSQRHESDEESSDSDNEEYLRGKREALDVGYGHLGAVSIVTPGKAEVKEASNLERLRLRNSPASKVEVNRDGASPDPLGGPTRGKRSRLKKIWKKKHSSQSDSSGELRIVAEGENGTEVDLTVQTDREAYKQFIQPESTPTSGELQQGSEDQSPDESREETRGMKKVHNIMHRISKKAHIVSSAIYKMSPSKKRSHSGKNLGENFVNVNQVESHMPEASTSAIDSTRDEVTQAENTSVTESQADAINDVESDDAEAETGKFYITQDSFVSAAPVTPSDQDFSSVVLPPQRIDGEYFYPDSVPTAKSTITEKSPPASPVNPALSPCGSGHSLAKDFIVVKWPRRVDLDHADKDAGSSSSQVVRNSDEVQVTALRTFPENSTDCTSQSSATKVLGSHTESVQKAGQEQLVEQRTILDQESGIPQRSPEEESDQHVLSDSADLTDSNLVIS